MAEIIIEEVCCEDFIKVRNSNKILIDACMNVHTKGWWIEFVNTNLSNLERTYFNSLDEAISVLLSNKNYA